MRTPFRSAVLTLSLVSGGMLSGIAAGQGAIDALVERGQELFDADIGCWVCHAQTGTGLVGPSLHFGPTPVDILDRKSTRLNSSH